MWPARCVIYCCFFCCINLFIECLSVCVAVWHTTALWCVLCNGSGTGDGGSIEWLLPRLSKLQQFPVRSVSSCYQLAHQRRVKLVAG